MSAKIDSIIEELKTLSLLEASELVKAIEETFGVSAAAPVGGVVVAAAGGAAAVEEVEEKTTLLTLFSLAQSRTEFVPM